MGFSIVRRLSLFGMQWTASWTRCPHQFCPVKNLYEDAPEQLRSVSGL